MKPIKLLLTLHCQVEPLYYLASVVRQLIRRLHMYGQNYNLQFWFEEFSPQLAWPQGFEVESYDSRDSNGDSVFLISLFISLYVFFTVSLSFSLIKKSVFLFRFNLNLSFSLFNKIFLSLSLFLSIRFFCNISVSCV